MKCQFRARLLPAAMWALVEPAGGRLRSSVLRQWALLGLDAVRGGIDLRSRAAALCVGSDAAATLIVRVPEESALGHALVELEPQLATGHGAIFAALAVLGWERSAEPRHAAAPLAPRTVAVASVATAPAQRSPAVATPPPPAQTSSALAVEVEADDALIAAAGEGLLREFLG